ncbi:ketopantoate reductase family protein [Streptosporangium sp. CA-135522]|uniref:ketopantoate reductase family protein n=1 Tax=Streptosporangium sp. CA-135522 TaxID=3240072 RepID=UPI003D8F0011
MRYIVVGAGAVGGTIGGRLFQSGHEVLLVARGAHHDALRRDGLRLVTPDSTETLPVPVTDEPVRLRGDDVLILAVKSQDRLDPGQPERQGLRRHGGVRRQPVRRVELIT